MLFYNLDSTFGYNANSLKVLETKFFMTYNSFKHFFFEKLLSRLKSSERLPGLPLLFSMLLLASFSTEGPRHFDIRSDRSLSGRSPLAVTIDRSAVVSKLVSREYDLCLPAKICSSAQKVKSLHITFLN